MCKAGCRRSFRSEPLLLYSAVRASLGEFHWWMEYGRNFRRSGCQRLSELLVQFCGVWSSLVDVGLRRCVSFKAELRQR